MNFVRRLEGVTYTAGATVPVELDKSLMYRDLAIRLTGQPTIAGASNTRATTARGGAWSAVARIAIRAGNETIFECSGIELVMLNAYLYGRMPEQATALGDGATANPSFDVVAIIPSELLRGRRRGDSFFDAGRLVNYRLEVTWAAHTAVNSNASGWTTNPAIEVNAAYVVPNRNPAAQRFTPRFNQRIVSVQKTYSAAATADRFKLETGIGVRALIINTLNSTGTTDTTGIVTNAKLFAGGQQIAEFSESMLRQYANLHARMPHFQTSLPNCGITVLDISAMGTANNTLQDYTGSYSESACENNAADLGAKINEIINFLNGRTMPVNWSQSSLFDPRAWLILDITPDGFMADAIDTEQLNDFYLELNVSGASIVNVLALQLKDLAQPGLTLPR